MATSDIENPAGPKPGRVKNAILIAGPTASGKSALAIELAVKHGGAIINADSMQVYAGLRVLTARPDDRDLSIAPHHLYGHVDPADDYSTGAWLRDVKALLDGDALEGRRPIFVGGTGLYFRALTEGLSQMPDIPSQVRDRWRYHIIEDGVARLHEILFRRDPAAALRIDKTDSQRVVRALEVLDASGRSILEWQAMRDEPLVDLPSAHAAALEIPRELLVKRIDARFDRMVEEGALDEVKDLLARRIGVDKPAMKAIGVREFSDAIEGRLTMAEAIERAKIATRQYAKRQTTWFRHQFGPQWKRINPQQAS
ncbi:tRNA (adenosine(37)-N6)-dimethylallyltransferase MiaA [Arvimicrobium flavum]|uniref:tRNA (adenosine(37)-N6)-dimethylallyltransferase MiaA n=1 Tax=Arvimicrobium flavum TaxID=3393320 RepID=UPI00398D1153